MMNTYLNMPSLKGNSHPDDIPAFSPGRGRPCSQPELSTATAQNCPPVRGVKETTSTQAVPVLFAGFEALWRHVKYKCLETSIFSTVK